MSALLLRRTLRRSPRARSFTASRLPISLLAASFALLATFSPASSARAADYDDSIPTPEFLTQLEQRAGAASPREQAYLYTILVHSMTEMAGKQLSDGDETAAESTLKQISHYAHLIQTSLAHNTSKLKNAEMLMQHTTWRLAQCVHLAPADDKPQLQATLRELNQTNDALLNQVFLH